MMNEEIAASVISRCRISNIESTLMRWGRLTSAEVKWLMEKKPTKAHIMKKFCELIMRNDLNHEILGDLELAYVQLHPRCKLWKVFQLKGKGLKLNIDPRSLRSRLVKHMKLSWRDGEVHGNMSLFTGAVWLRVHLDSSNIRRRKGKNATATDSYRRHQSVFLVLFQHSPYVIISTAGQRLSKIVNEALKHVLAADNLIMQLSGRHVASLADIIHKQQYEALSTKFRDKEREENSLCPRKKRKIEDVTEEPESIDGIVDENKKEKCTRIEYLKENFGDGAQPELETITYKFNTDFCGKPGLSCVSSVEIKGPSVLQGVCDAVKSGIFKCPLPKHITAVTSRARNSFVLESKKK